MSKTKPMSENPTTDVKELNPQHQLFVKLYTGKHLGNATQAYMEAYDVEFEVAKASWSRLLTNVNIKEAIRLGLTKQGFTDENADAQHLFLMNQFEDFPTKARMIEHYNKLMGRIKEKTEHSMDDPMKLLMEKLLDRSEK